jgi:2-oxo-3-(phosphooxy)propyl 3-oxoalkanoate synthase
MSMDYGRTVPRHLVHRRAVAEVFITDYSFDTEGAYQVGVQLPPAHRIFDTSSRRDDPLGVAEAFRQTVVLLCHTRYQIPTHYSFLMETFSVDMLSSQIVAAAASPLTFHLTVDKLNYRDNAVSGVDVSGILSDGTTDIARCTAVARGASPDGYRRIRQGREHRYPSQRFVPSGSIAVSAARAGRLIDRDVNVALFDHAVDHIPGMIIFEAGRQALRYRTGNPAAQISSFSAVFPRFTEWEVPCQIRVYELGEPTHAGGRYCVRFTQDNALTAELDVTLSDAQ